MVYNWAREVNVNAYSVSRLAKMAGVSVRTLHHYDHIGLLEPSDRTEAGYRLYGDAVPVLVVLPKDYGCLTTGAEISIAPNGTVTAAADC